MTQTISKDTFECYKKLLEREWVLERLYRDLEAKQLKLTDSQQGVLELILCGLSPKDIAIALNKQSGAIRNQLANALVPRVMELCNTDPEQSIVFSDIPQLLAKHGYAKSSWSWLQSQAKPTYERIRPTTHLGSNGSFRDIDDSSTPETEKLVNIPKVSVQARVSFQFDFPENHNLIVLNKGTSQNVYCLVPSRYAPVESSVKRLPLPNHGSIKFNAVGQEQFLAIVSKERMWLSWLDDVTVRGLRKLEPIHLDELAEVIHESQETTQLYYSSLNVV